MLFCFLSISFGKARKEEKSAKHFSITNNTFKVLGMRQATMILQWNDVILYVDPVGSKTLFQSYPLPDLILITDNSEDHFKLTTLEGLNTSKAKIVIPSSVADNIPNEFTPQLDLLENGDMKERFGITIQALPKYHSKYEGNSYVLKMNGERIYISGNVQDIKEIHSLKKIDRAFISVNPSKTFTVENTVAAVLAFQPKIVYPYYSNANGSSNAQKFKTLISGENVDIEVKLLDW